jgi:septum formation protein
MTLKNNAKPNFRLILASSSPYRQELLSRLRFPFEAIPPHIDERPLLNESAEKTALRLAHEKAQAIATNHPDAIIIGSDQVVILENEQIGKPGNHVAALQQLQKMQGETVAFHTALCVIDGRNKDDKSAFQTQCCNIQTLVTFRTLSDTELDAYLRIEQPYDCAGSAKNEGLGIALIEKIQSDDPTALTGLPLIALSSMLRQINVTFFAQ